MPRRRIRENDIRRLLREYLKLELPSILVESSLDLRSSKEEWLRTRRLKCKPDVLLTPLPSQCSAEQSSTEAIIREAGLILLNATFREVEEFIDRHIGKQHIINGTKGVLSHFVVEPYIPHRPDEEFDLMIHSRRLVNVITFGPHSSPRKAFIEVPIESDVTAAPISEVLLYPFLSGPGGGYSSASIHKMSSLICLIYKFFDELSFTSLEFTPLAILKSQAAAASAAQPPQSVSTSRPKSPKDKTQEDMASSVPFALRFCPPPSSPPPPPPPKPPAASPLTGSGDNGDNGDCGGYSVPLTRPNRSYSVAVKASVNTHFDKPEMATRPFRSKSISTRVPLMENMIDEDVNDVDEDDDDDITANMQQKANEKARVDSLIIPLDISGEADYNAMSYKADKWFSGSTSPDDFFPVVWGSQQYREEDIVDSMSSPCTNATLRLTVVNPDARIWFIAAGAGAAMIVADTLVHRGFGHELGNFCEYTGAVTEDQTYQLCKIVIDLAIKSGRNGTVILLVGCIANYTDVSITNKGFVRAISEEKQRLCEHQIRIIVRRPGPNYHSALHEMRKCSRETGVDIRAFGPEVALTSTVGMAISYIEAFDKNTPPKPTPNIAAIPKSPVQNQLRQPHFVIPAQQTGATTTTTTTSDTSKSLLKPLGNNVVSPPAQKRNVVPQINTLLDTQSQSGTITSPAQSIFQTQPPMPSPGGGGGGGTLSAAVPVPQPLFSTAGIFGSSPQSGASSLFTPISSHIQQNQKKQQQQQQAIKDPQPLFSKQNTNEFSFGVVTPRHKDSPAQHATQQCAVPQQQESSQLARSPLLSLTISSLQSQRQNNTGRGAQVFPPKPNTNDFSFGTVAPRHKDSPAQHATQQCAVPQQQQEPVQLAKSPLPPLSITSLQTRQQQQNNTGRGRQVFPPKPNTNDFSFGVVTPRHKDSPAQHATQQCAVPQQQESSQLARSPLLSLTISSLQSQRQQNNTGRGAQVFPPKTSTDDFSFGTVAPRHKDSPAQHATQQCAVPQQQEPVQLAKSPLPPLSITSLQTRQQQQMVFRSPSNSPSFKPAMVPQKISFMNDSLFGGPAFTKSPVIAAGDLGTTAFDGHPRKNHPPRSLQDQIAAAGIGPLPGDSIKPFMGGGGATAVPSSSTLADMQPVCANSPSMCLNGSNSGNASRSTSIGPQDKKII